MSESMYCQHGNSNTTLEMMMENPLNPLCHIRLMQEAVEWSFFYVGFNPELAAPAMVMAVAIICLVGK